jgi:uncharacterized membrane protein YfcA
MLWIALTFIAAGIVHGAVGFGIPLVAMPLLIQLHGIRVASPVLALLATSLAPFFLWRYRESVDLKAIGRIVVAAFVGIPLGVTLLRLGDGDLITRALGVVLFAYALYAWLTPRLPELNHPIWALVFGFLGGVLTGAYAVGGIPVIIYATCRRWPLVEFKGNLQSYFLIAGLFLITNHGISGNLTSMVWQDFAIALPASLVGLAAGFKLDHYLTGTRFLYVVLLLLMAMSLRLIFA